MLLCYGRDAAYRSPWLRIRRHCSVEVVQGGEDTQADIPRIVELSYASLAVVAILRLTRRRRASKMVGLGSRCGAETSETSMHADLGQAFAPFTIAAGVIYHRSLKGAEAPLHSAIQVPPGWPGLSKLELE